MLVDLDTMYSNFIVLQLFGGDMRIFQPSGCTDSYIVFAFIYASYLIQLRLLCANKVALNQGKINYF